MNAMLTQCDNGGCKHPIFPVTITLWVLSSVGTVVWLRYVYKRYEVTVALPVEYGSAVFADVVSGLLFFQEYDIYSLWRLCLIIAGSVLCLVGIQVAPPTAATSTATTTFDRHPPYPRSSRAHSLSACSRPRVARCGTAACYRTPTPSSQFAIGRART